MNIKGNQRAISTENNIKNAFLNLLKEKDIRKISVSEICSRAVIHRTTFYAHYQDVRDLMEHLVGEMYLQVMGYFLKDGKPLKGDGFFHLFHLVQEHKAFFRSYLEISGTRLFDYELLPEVLRKQVDELVQAMEFTSAEELYYHQTFFCAGLSAVIKRWILRDCMETPEQMCALIAREYSPNRDIFMGEKTDVFYTA